MGDLLPKSLLPAGHLMIGIAFSLRSIGGPLISRVFIQFFPNISFFYMIVTTLVIIWIAIFVKKDHSQIA